MRRILAIAVVGSLALSSATGCATRIDDDAGETTNYSQK